MRFFTAIKSLVAALPLATSIAHACSLGGPFPSTFCGRYTEVGERSADATQVGVRLDMGYTQLYLDPACEFAIHTSSAPGWITIQVIPDATQRQTTITELQTRIGEPVCIFMLENGEQDILEMFYGQTSVEEAFLEGRRLNPRDHRED